MIAWAQVASALLLSAAGVQAAGVDPSLPLHQPRPVDVPRSARYLTPEGAIAVVGYNDMREMLEPIVAIFTATHPGLRFKLDLPGTRFAAAALAKGESAFAPMGAEITPSQLAEYRAATGSDPIAFRVAHASLDPRALSGPLAIFVHRDNPLASLTLEQVAGVFTGEAKRWGDLGLKGPWAERVLNVYGVERGAPLALALQKSGMGGRAFGPQMTGVSQSADVVKRVSEDPLSIGFSAAMRATPGVRALALASRAGAEPVALTEDAIVAGRYPLDRFLLIYARRPLTSLVREFVQLVLSREGQAAIAATPQRYLPLSAPDAAVERAKLE